MGRGVACAHAAAGLFRPSGMAIAGLYVSAADLAFAALPGGLQRAVFLVLGKFPEAMGALQFAWDRLWRSHSRLIEYK